LGSGFAAQVAGHFEQWDQDQNGVLSFLETSRLVPDTSIRDEAAAALAAVHLVQRIDRWFQVGFPRSELVPPRGAIVRGRPPFEAYYEASLAHIRSTDRALFGGGAGGPSLRGFHQGLLGDCYFVATLGALVNRDASVLGRIVRERPDGTFDVRFPDGESVRVWHVSDSEIALGSYSGRQGLWLNVLEKAYGQLVERGMSRREVFEDAIDAPGSGGHATSALALFTGCDAAILRYRPENSPMLASEERVEAFLPMTRNLLEFNLRQGRLTCCGTTSATLPPGLVKEHLYAVVGFDPGRDVVEVWNPWGNDFKPGGASGLEFGYPAREGRMALPLKDFIRIFDSVTYETNRPETLE
jgi:hypothetical protein